MLLSGAPSPIQLPFATSGAKNAIPIPSQISITPGRASYTDGFPPLTRTKLEAGGVAPFGEDFNGLFYAITAIQQWQCSGGMFSYNSTQSTAIGGYAKGALLLKASGTGLWMSTADSNTTNPDTGGSNWTDALAGRLIGVRTITSTSTYTPTAGTNYVRVKVIGGGGAGGGAPATNSSQIGFGSGGSAGGYAEGVFYTGFSGVTVTVGAAGARALGANGGNGGTSSFGSLLTAPGGTGGGAYGPTSAPLTAGLGNAAAAPSGGYLNVLGQNGGYGFMTSGTFGYSGRGASSQWGAGGGEQNGSGDGVAATGYGAGGSGGLSPNSSTVRYGGNGTPGVVIIEEYS